MTQIDKSQQKPGKEQRQEYEHRPVEMQPRDIVQEQSPYDDGRRRESQQFHQHERMVRKYKTDQKRRDQIELHFRLQAPGDRIERSPCPVNQRMHISHGAEQVRGFAGQRQTVGYDIKRIKYHAREQERPADPGKPTPVINL